MDALSIKLEEKAKLTVAPHCVSKSSKPATPPCSRRPLLISMIEPSVVCAVTCSGRTGLYRLNIGRYAYSASSTRSRYVVDAGTKELDCSCDASGAELQKGPRQASARAVNLVITYTLQSWLLNCVALSVQVIVPGASLARGMTSASTFERTREMMEMKNRLSCILNEQRKTNEVANEGKFTSPVVVVKVQRVKFENWR